MAEIDERIKELRTKAEQYDLALRQEEEDNKDGSALNQAICLISQTKGMPQLASPSEGSKGKQ